MAKDIITGIIKRFYFYVNANNEKNIFCNKTLVAIDKYW